ncbi:D-amino acid dehydrogenase [Pusillimonas sp. ANT_WB101]|uniref:D-amino acid dehydrogenase n=1 Tax=Pusillimonas sp. ANT_WB101 TaxID=2597356 RepID=UPI0011EEB780|nr:D-amino acid dehydrogenase [Pusillimonas sp. ANT_WB101]KAA0911772.1 D-amino acid dehydrogenase [Pusillimonas sp. ANT_WB101]
MNIIVLGSGIIGISTAWWLREAGHDVTVIDRECGPAQGATRANGGQVSVSYSEPWASPQAPLKLARWLFKEDAPLLFRPRLDTRQWRWGAMFLRECLPARLSANVGAMLRLSEYSRQTLQFMRRELGIEYNHLERGILNFYRDQNELDSSQKMADIMRDFGVDRRVVTTEEIISIEPALAPMRDRIVGGDYTSEDESGDAYLFTCALAERARDAGVQFMYSTRVCRLLAADGRIQGAEVVGADGLYHTVGGDAFVAALGAHTPQLVTPLGVACEVYPTKGYSASFRVLEAEAAPTVSLTDGAHKVVYTRLGDQLRMAGTAELAGYSRALNTIRCENMLRQAQELFPTALDFDNVQFWSGLRPSTPSNVPLIGKTSIQNLYLNTGHGTLGWTMGAGSGRALADLMSGQQPKPEFPFLG